MIITGAEVLIKEMEKEKVEVIFGYPGGAILPVYDALRKSKRIRHVLVRQEQNAVHAASGFARVSGKVGVCMTTSGPGATNLVTGLATAYADSIPIVAITGQVATKMVGTDAFQEVDIIGITKPITKQNYLVKRTNELPEIIKEAFHIASTGRPGPVLIDLPKDIAESLYQEELPNIKNPDNSKFPALEHPPQIKNACLLMEIAKKPVILAGGGVIAADAAEELMRLSKLLQAPVTTTLMGLGAIPTEDEMNLGMPGIHGHAVANQVIMNSDLLITVGARFDDRMTGASKKFAPRAKIIHIDIDPGKIGKNVAVDVPIVGHIKDVLREIIEGLKNTRPKNRKNWHNQVQMWKREEADSYPDSTDNLTTRAVLQRFNEVSGGEFIITTDVGQHQMFAAQFLKLKRPKSFISSGGLGTMGYGLPAAIGVQMSDPGAKVVCITGDGSFQMNMNELATAKEQGLPLKILIFNNNCLALVKQLQHFYCDRREMAVEMTGNPDFVKLAEAYRIDGYRISHISEIDQVLEKALSSGKLCIVDCIIKDEEFVYPTVLAGKGLDEIVVGI